MVGLIDKVQVATEETEIAQEKEHIQNVITGFRLDNTQMNAENLQKELNNSSGNTDIKVEQVGENDFLVTFPSGRIYEVADGNVEYIGKEGELEDVIISVNKEQDLEEKQIQEVEVTINTYKNRDDNQTVTLQYTWSDSKDTRTSGYKSAILEGNNISKKAIISSGDLETGNYYLWLRVKVNGKNIEKTYGEYYIKKYPTLVRVLNERSATGGFLGNTDIQRGKIKTITLQNTLDGKSTDESKCWDVSKAKNREILAWYEEENIEGNTYYNVTIGAEGKMKANEDSSELFAYIGYDVTNAEVKIEGLENLDTSNVNEMDDMFYECKNLKNLDLKSFNTSNVRNMRSMFSRCQALTSLNLGSFDTNKLIYMDGLFSGCSSLTSLDLSNFNTNNVKDMSRVFFSCRKLKNVNVSHFNTENVTNFSSMFYECFELQSIDVSHFDTSNATSMSGMFRDCDLLQNIDVSHFKTNNVETMLWMFYGCENLQSINVNNFNTSNVWNLDGMFQGCRKLQNIDLSNFDVRKVTDIRDLVSGCSNLQELNLKNWELSENARTESMLNGVRSDIVIKVSSPTMKSRLIDVKPSLTDANFVVSE